MKTIDKSVGKGDTNLPIDVIKIQNLINNNNTYTKLAKPLPLTGIANNTLNKAIATFQSNHPDLPTSDGRVDPHGKTINALKQYSNTEQQCRNYYPLRFNTQHLQTSFDTTLFLNLYAKQFPSPLLTATRSGGLKILMDNMIADSDLNNIFWAAYMLATTKHECANTWQPIGEYGKGSGATVRKDY